MRAEHSHGGYRTKREAIAAAAALRTDAARGSYVPPDRLTVAGYLLGEWMPARANADISPNTRDVELTMIESWILPHIGDRVLQRLSARDLDRLYATLRERGGRGGKGLRGKSIRNVHVLLSKSLGDAVRRGHLVANPVAAVDPPAKDDSVERTAWTAEEVRTFLNIAADDRLHAVWRVLLATGVRRGEVLGLQWPDADLEAGTLTVARQVLLPPRAPQIPYVRETTKTRRVRRVRVDEQTTTALRAWKAQQASERLLFGGAYKTDGGLGVEAAWIVTEPDGWLVRPATLAARWAALVKLAGVPALTLHGARHSFAELALGAGVRLDVVSRQLGHASISTTASNYLHDNDEAAAEAAAKVAAALEGGR